MLKPLKKDLPIPIAVAIIIIVLSIAGWLTYQKASDLLLSSNENPSQLESKATPMPKKPRTEKDCEILVNNDEKDTCYLEVVSNENDPANCRNVQNEEWKAICYDDSYLEQAQQKKDPSFCDKILNNYEKDFCYFEVAKLNQDIKICDQIQNQEAKKECVSGK